LLPSKGGSTGPTYIETLDIRSELTTNEYECFHEAERAYVFSVLPIDNLI